MTMATDPTQLLLEETPKQATAVVIDSLSNLIFHRSPSFTCQVLHRLSRTNQGKVGTVLVSVFQIIQLY